MTYWYKMKKRCFISLNLPENAVEEIVQIQKQLEKENLFVGKFTEPENLHLTLKFLGEIDREKIEEVKKKLEKIKFKSFEAELKNCGFFDNQKYGVVWVHLANCEKLQKEIDDALIGLFEPEKRFMGHITIARVKKVHDKNKLITFLNKIKTKNIKFNVGGFYLMESKLSKKGPIYSIIEKYNLIN